MTDEIKDENPDQPEVQVADTPEEETPNTPEDENTDTPEKEEEPKADPEDESKDDADAKDEDEEEDEQDAGSDYNEYEHPALKQAVNILKEANLPVDEANAIFAEAVDSGDLSKINKDALVKKLGQDKADIVLVLAESYYNTQFSQFKAISEEAYKLTGGEENFVAMREWANDKAANDPEFKKDFQEFKAMLDSKQPRAIKAAIRELFDIYKQDPDTTIAADLEVGDAAVGSAGVEPMTLRQYTDAIDKAHRDGTYEAVHKALWARRSAGKRKGI